MEYIETEVDCNNERCKFLVACGDYGNFDDLACRVSGNEDLNEFQGEWYGQPFDDLGIDHCPRPARTRSNVVNGSMLVFGHDSSCDSGDTFTGSLAMESLNFRGQSWKKRNVSSPYQSFYFPGYLCSVVLNDGSLFLR